MSEQPLVIHHANCFDGVAAAWAAWAAHPDAEFWPANYGDEPPVDAAAGRPVYVLDYSYPREQLMLLYQHADTLTVLDHHESAQDALGSLVGADLEGLHVEFDMERSGCTMAWDHFHGGPRPRWLEHVEDRDLWRFALDSTREVMAYVQTIPKTVADYEVHVAQRWDDEGPEVIIDLGRTILTYDQLRRADVVEQARYLWWTPAKPGGRHRVAVANCPYRDASEVANTLLEANPNIDFAACWYQQADGQYRFSLRGRDSGPSVKEVAVALGGGGHRNAAGCALDDLPREIAE